MYLVGRTLHCITLTSNQCIRIEVHLPGPLMIFGSLVFNILPICRAIKVFPVPVQKKVKNMVFFPPFIHVIICHASCTLNSNLGFILNRLMSPKTICTLYRITVWVIILLLCIDYTCNPNTDWLIPQNLMDKVHKIRNSRTFQGFMQIRRLFKTSSQIQGLFNTVRTLSPLAYLVAHGEEFL